MFRVDRLTEDSCPSHHADTSDELVPCVTAGSQPARYGEQVKDVGDESVATEDVETGGQTPCGLASPYVPDLVGESQAVIPV